MLQSHTHQWNISEIMRIQYFCSMSFLLMSHPKIRGISILIACHHCFSDSEATLVITKEMAMLLCYMGIFRFNALQSPIITGSSWTKWRLKSSQGVEGGISGWTVFVRHKIQFILTFRWKLIYQKIRHHHVKMSSLCSCQHNISFTLCSSFQPV